MSKKRTEPHKKNKPKAKEDNYNFSKEFIEKNRTFPKTKALLLAACVIAQIVLVIFCFSVETQPQDVIKNYSVTVHPLDDGSLDIEYNVTWQALDTTEALTWVKIGMANSDYTVYDKSVSDNIDFYDYVNEDGYTALELYFTESYIGGDILNFKFKINQKSMLCEKGSCKFFEFTPGWFNATPIETYIFRWKASEQCTNRNSLEKIGNYYTLTGSLDCGEYKTFKVEYSKTAFENAVTVPYTPFDGSGAYNELKDEDFGKIVLLVLIIVFIFFVEFYILDAFISYKRGRGFLSGHGHRVHVYGRTNPRYITARNAYNATHSSGGRGFGGGGCACACACACAGGGRAGCSQKDGYTNEEKTGR